MLRDNAIKEGLLEPTKEDIERMQLSPEDLIRLGWAKRIEPKVEVKQPEVVEHPAPKKK